jgi:ADP-ribose pyrophosphatase YjhB (NUDIX family)
MLMQKRPSARLLVLNDEQHVLLFRFEHKDGPLSGQVFWATPGGGLDEGESYEDAARRELYEEVGMEIEHPGLQVAQRTAIFALPDGAMVEADERYFVVSAGGHAVSDSNWTELERDVMAAHRWWSHAELQSTAEQVWPDDLPAMLVKAGIWKTAP